MSTLLTSLKEGGGRRNTSTTKKENLVVQNLDLWVTRGRFSSPLTAGHPLNINPLAFTIYFYFPPTPLTHPIPKSIGLVAEQSLTRNQPTTEHGRKKLAQIEKMHVRTIFISAY